MLQTCKISYVNYRQKLRDRWRFIFNSRVFENQGTFLSWSAPALLPSLEPCPSLRRWTEHHYFLQYQISAGIWVVAICSSFPRVPWFPLWLFDWVIILFVFLISYSNIYSCRAFFHSCNLINNQVTNGISSSTSANDGDSAVSHLLHASMKVYVQLEVVVAGDNPALLTREGFQWLAPISILFCRDVDIVDIQYHNLCNLRNSTGPIKNSMQATSLLFSKVLSEWTFTFIFK